MTQTDRQIDRLLFETDGRTDRARERKGKRETQETNGTQNWREKKNT